MNPDKYARKTKELSDARERLEVQLMRAKIVMNVSSDDLRRAKRRNQVHEDLVNRLEDRIAEMVIRPNNPEEM